MVFPLFFFVYGFSSSSAISSREKTASGLPL